MVISTVASRTIAVAEALGILQQADIVGNQASDVGGL